MKLISNPTIERRRVAMTNTDWLALAVHAHWIPNTFTKTSSTIKTAHINNLRISNNSVTINPVEWAQIGLQTGWLTKESQMWNSIKDFFIEAPLPQGRLTPSPARSGR